MHQESVLRSVIANSIAAALTSVYPCRVWCAGELAIAVNAGIPLILPAFQQCHDDNFEELSIASLEQVWSHAELHPLLSVGIGVKAIRKVYMHLASIPLIS